MSRCATVSNILLILTTRDKIKKGIRSAAPVINYSIN